MRKLTYKEQAALVEFAERRKMAINMFRPQPHQEQIFRSTAKYGLYLGGNRAGKTLCAALKFAAIAMDMAITMPDGTQIFQRRPHQRGKCLRMWVIGADSRHIGETIYRILFRAGEAFRVIRDKNTGELRAWRRWEPDDAAREKETQPNPALIPARCIDQKSWSFENKANREFNKVTIIDPVTKEPLADIHAYSSKADPKAGDPVDVIWIDERIEYEQHYPEWVARLVDRGGFLYWSSWPDTSNEALSKLHERCQEEAEKTDKTYECVTLTMSANKTLSEQDKADFLAGCQSDEERMARDLGIFVTEQLKMYPLFNPTIHTAMIGDPDEPVEGEDELSKVLKECDGVPPRDWTRELILDPGTQSPGVLLCAIPPPKFGDYLVIYDEIFPGRADADQLANIIRDRTLGQRFHRFIIDARAHGQTGMGYGNSVGANYTRAFEQRRIGCRSTGSNFTLGSTDVGGRIMKLQALMHVRPNGYPKLRIVTQKCKNLCKQLQKYRKDGSNKLLVDDRPARGQTIDLAVCYDIETEVLTRLGWKKFSDLMYGEELATFNMQSEMLEYQLPSYLHRRQFDGEMVRIDSRRLDCMVTPNHRMVVRTQSGKLKIRYAKDLRMTDSIPLCPSGFAGVRPVVRMQKVTGGLNQIETIQDVPAFAELIGWFVAEGSCVKYRKRGRGYQVSISQHKLDGRKSLEDCLSRNPFHYTVDGGNYLISHKQLWSYLRPLGKSHEKYVPQWIKSADTEVIAAFLKGYIAGDGWKRADRCGSTSASARLSDDIQELMLKTGVSARVDIRPATAGVIRGVGVVGNFPAHVVTTASRQTDALLYRKNKLTNKCESIITSESYSGEVFCATVPNGTLIVRRNGKVMVSGNCAEYWAASNPTYYPYKPSAEEGGPAYMRYLQLFGDRKTSETPVRIGTSYRG